MSADNRVNAYEAVVESTMGIITLQGAALQRIADGDFSTSGEASAIANHTLEEGARYVADRIKIYQTNAD